MPTADPADSAVRVAVLIPIYGHVALAMEAIQSASDQDLGDELHVICVVDGDRDPTLARLLTSFAAMPANRCSPYWRRNGGLSAARNNAIDIALSRFRNLEAVFFLDADNRLGPNALGEALRRLRRGDADIVYPHLVNFGLRSSQDTAGPFSAAALLRGNYIEAGSLVAVSVLQRGLRFDETLREGYEDWAFWLRALSAGFRFAQEATLRLQYRRRPESMLAHTSRNSARVRGGIEAVNQDLFSPVGRQRIEARDEPRYALVHADSGFVEFSSDPGTRADQVDIAAAGVRLNRHRAAPTWTYFPPLVCFAASETIDALRSAGLLPGLLWRLAATKQGCCGCRFEHGSRVSIDAVADDDDAQLILVSRQSLCEAIKMRKPLCGAPMVSLEMVVPSQIVASAKSVRDTAETIIESWGAQEIAASAKTPWSWRSPVAVRCSPDVEANPFPRAPVGTRQVGFVLSEMGSEGSRLSASAHAFREAGWTPHLLVQGNAVPADVLASFATTTFLGAPTEQIRAPHPSDQTFFGAKLGGAAHAPSLSSMAAFQWLEAVVIFSAHEVLPIAGRLRADGASIVVTWDGADEQVAPEISPGDDLPYLFCAYEHAIDAFVIPTNDALLLAALGVPRSKICQGDEHLEPHALVDAVERYQKQSCARARFDDPT